MYSNERKSSTLRIEEVEVQDYGISQTPLSNYYLYEPQSISFPSNESISPNYSLLPDPDLFYLPAHEKRANSEDQEVVANTEISITPFKDLMKAALENKITTRSSAKRLLERFLETGVQGSVENNDNIESTTRINHRPTTEYKQQQSTPQPKTKRQKKLSPLVGETEKFPCKLCKYASTTSQGLGGHMSRSHPGKSRAYRKKKGIRKTREMERYRLQLAKKRYSESLNKKLKAQRLAKEQQDEIMKVIDRKKLKKIKKSITKKELNDYIENEVLYSEGFERK
jgi:hypothetical protein